MIARCILRFSFHYQAKYKDQIQGYQRNIQSVKKYVQEAQARLGLEEATSKKQQQLLCTREQETTDFQLEGVQAKMMRIKNNLFLRHLLHQACQKYLLAKRSSETEKKALEDLIEDKRKGFELLATKCQQKKEGRKMVADVTASLKKKFEECSAEDKANQAKQKKLEEEIRAYQERRTNGLAQIAAQSNKIASLQGKSEELISQVAETLEPKIKPTKWRKWGKRLFASFCIRRSACTVL